MKYHLIQWKNPQQPQAAVKTPPYFCKRPRRVSNENPPGFFGDKRLGFDYTEQNRRRLCGKFASMSNLFIVGSSPVEICKTIPARRSTICATERPSVPPPAIMPQLEPLRSLFSTVSSTTSGYCSTAGTPYFGYKLHALCNENVVIRSFDLTPSVCTTSII